MSKETKRDETMDPIGRLVRLAGPRTRIPPESAERVRAHVARSWERSVRRRRARRISWAGGGALAAAAALLLLLRLGPAAAPEPVPPPPAPRLAAVERVEGVPTARLEDEPARTLVAGVELRAGEVLETGPYERLALRLDTGHSVRLDRSSRLRLVSVPEMVLERGAVYVDSSDRASSGVDIVTPRGRVEEIGTQFEVRLSERELRIRVREGSISWNGGEDVAAGAELLVLEDGSRRRRSIDRHGTDWSWIQEIAPPFELEGRSLAEYLEWISRETGREVEFRGPANLESAAAVRLHGDLEAMSPERTLAAVLPTCGLRHRMIEHRIRIEEAP